VVLNLGRFINPARDGYGYVYSHLYTLYVEKGFKWHPVCHRLSGSKWNQVYGGLDDSEGLFISFQPIFNGTKYVDSASLGSPSENTTVIEHDKYHIKVRKHWAITPGTCRLFNQSWVAFPSTKIFGEFVADQSGNIALNYELIWFYGPEGNPTDFLVPLTSGIVQRSLPTPSLIHACDATNDWSIILGTGSLSIDTGDKKEGNGSLKAVITSDASGNWGIRLNPAGTWDLPAKDTLDLWLELPISSATIYIRDASDNYKYWTVSGLYVNALTPLNLPLANPTGQSGTPPNMAAIDKIDIQFTANPNTEYTGKVDYVRSDIFFDIVGASETLADNYIVMWRESKPFIVILSLEKKPASIRWETYDFKYKAIFVKYPAQSVGVGETKTFPGIYIAPLKLHFGSGPWTGDITKQPTANEREVIVKIAHSSLTFPSNFSLTFPSSNKEKATIRHNWTYESVPANDFGITQRPLTPVPRYVNYQGAYDFFIKSIHGDIYYLNQSSADFELPLPESLLNLTKSVKIIDPATWWGKRIYEIIDRILGYQSPEGYYSQNACYGDTRLCTSLMLLYPGLTAKYKTLIASTVKKVLDYWWTHLLYHETYGIYYFENNGIPDHGAIAGYIYYVTALYSAYVDPEYTSSKLTAINQLQITVEDWLDYDGVVWANPAVTTTTCDCESEVAIEGALSQAAYYHLLDQAGQLSANIDKVRGLIAITYGYIVNVMQRYEKYWADPKFMSVYWPHQANDQSWYGPHPKGWDWATNVWGFLVPLMFDYYSEKIVRNVKDGAEDQGWTDESNPDFSLEYLTYFNIVMGLKKFTYEVYKNVKLAEKYAILPAWHQHPSIMAEHAFQLAHFNEYKTNFDIRAEERGQIIQVVKQTKTGEDAYGKPILSEQATNVKGFVSVRGREKAVQAGTIKLGTVKFLLPLMIEIDETQYELEWNGVRWEPTAIDVKRTHLEVSAERKVK